MKEGSQISAGSCLGKVFLLLINWESREEQLDSHSLSLGPSSCSVGQICPFLAQFSSLLMGITVSMERAGTKPLYTKPLPHLWHLAQDPTTRSPSPLSGDLEVFANSSDKFLVLPQALFPKKLFSCISSSQP